MLEILHRLAIDRHNDVAVAQAALCGRAVRLNLGDFDTAAGACCRGCRKSRTLKSRVDIPPAELLNDALSEFRRYRPLPAVTNVIDAYLFALTFEANGIDELAVVVDALVVETNNDVIHAQTRVLSR